MSTPASEWLLSGPPRSALSGRAARREKATWLPGPCQTRPLVMTDTVPEPACHLAFTRTGAPSALLQGALDPGDRPLAPAQHQPATGQPRPPPGAGGAGGGGGVGQAA